MSRVAPLTAECNPAVPIAEGRPVAPTTAAASPATVTASIPKRVQAADVGIILADAIHPSGARRVVIKDMPLGTPAHDAQGLSVGDPVVLINGSHVPSAAAGQRLLKNAPAGCVEVQVARPVSQRTVLLRKSGGEAAPPGIRFGVDGAWDGSRRVVIMAAPGVTGLTYGDSVLSINRVGIKSAEMAGRLLREAPPGDVELHIATDSNTFTTPNTADYCLETCDTVCSVQ